MKYTGCMPSMEISVLINPPFTEKKQFIMPTKTTVEIKWGRYVMVWEIRRKPRLGRLCITRANKTGMGKPAIREYKLSARVFPISRMACGLLKNVRNHFKPTQGLPVMPLEKLKSRKAIWIPYMGK